MIDDGLGDEVRVTVIATGFDKPGGVSARRSTGPRAPAPRPSRAGATGTSVMDERQRSSLEIPDDEIDIPSFLKD